MPSSTRPSTIFCISWIIAGENRRGLSLTGFGSVNSIFYFVRLIVVSFLPQGLTQSLSMAPTLTLWSASNSCRPTQAPSTSSRSSEGQSKGKCSSFSRIIRVLLRKSTIEPNYLRKSTPRIQTYTKESTKRTGKALRVPEMESCVLTSTSTASIDLSSN